MISFIIIGRNEGWKLNKCFESIFETIEYNQLENPEVIYVDSKSTDNSIEVAKAFKKVKVFLIKGVCNAAVARNIGAQEAKGDILFFIDGDMEINKEFLTFVLENNQLKYDCVTGHLDDYLYDYNDNFLGKKNRTYTNKIPSKEQVLKTNGGIFLIKKNIWQSLSGLRTKYKINEDNDLTLRLIKRKIRTVRIPVLITKHHTVDYKNDKRMWQDLLKFHSLYPGLLFRDHLLNPIAWEKTLRANYTAFLLVPFYLSLIIGNSNLQSFVIPSFILILLIRVAKQANDSNVLKNKGIYFSERIVLQLINDNLFWGGFIFFYPNSKKIEYNSIKQ